MAWPLPPNLPQEALLQLWAQNFPAQFGVPPRRPNQPLALGGTNTIHVPRPPPRNQRSRKRAVLRNKRPLNSFMAFRSYYSPMFRDIQQKFISGVINQMWHHDPFKAKWALIAKAYTIIRDRNSVAPVALNKYLRVVCPQVGIIDSNDYLEMLNWVWVQDAAGAKRLVQNPNNSFTGFDQRTTSTSMNEQDVINYCRTQGLLSSTHVTDNTNVASQHLMATTSQEAQQAFLHNITENPKAMAAQILGLDIDNTFLEISASEEPQYQWSGNMSEIYDANEQAIDVDSLGSTEWDTTDISNPIEFDNSLESLGYDPMLLIPDVPDHESLQYSFWNSF